MDVLILNEMDNFELWIWIAFETIKSDRNQCTLRIHRKRCHRMNIILPRILTFIWYHGDDNGSSNALTRWNHNIGLKLKMASTTKLVFITITMMHKYWKLSQKFVQFFFFFVNFRCKCLSADSEFEIPLELFEDNQNQKH